MGVGKKSVTWARTPLHLSSGGILLEQLLMRTALYQLGPTRPRGSQDISHVDIRLHAIYTAAYPLSLRSSFAKLQHATGDKPGAAQRTPESGDCPQNVVMRAHKTNTDLCLGTEPHVDWLIMVLSS